MRSDFLTSLNDTVDGIFLRSCTLKHFFSVFSNREVVNLTEMGIPETCWIVYISNYMHGKCFSRTHEKYRNNEITDEQQLKASGREINTAVQNISISETT